MDRIILFIIKYFTIPFFFFAFNIYYRSEYVWINFVRSRKKKRKNFTLLLRRVGYRRIFSVNNY